MKYILVAVLSILISGCAVVQGKSSPDQYAADAGITTQIKSKLIGSDMVSAPNIHVETQNGVVQLSGFVSSPVQIQEAERITRSVQGVRSIVNDLVVQSPKYRDRRG